MSYSTILLILNNTLNSNVSKKECRAVLLRYVELTDKQGTPKNFKPEQCLTKVFISRDTTGANLSSELLDMLKSLDINLSGMVGERLDSAGNMKGHCKGQSILCLKSVLKLFICGAACTGLH